jgi:2-polyprenyl-3-methyl-5-hydroxy-6-metoxy-1,4-benzoquinol methylase
MRFPNLPDMTTSESAENTGFDYSFHYRTWHDDSDGHASKMIGFHCDQLKPFLPERGPHAVLDIGCGMGFALLALGELGFADVRGIDLDREQIESCLRRNLRVERVEDTRRYLKEHPQSFDVVLMLDVLEHIPVGEQISTIRAVYGALRPGGRVILQVPNASCMLASRQRYIDYTHHCSFTEHSLRFVLKNAGFENIQIPGQGALRRPPLRLWRGSVRAGFVRWLVRYWWRLALTTELGDFERIEDISLELNLIAAAFRPIQQAGLQ